MKRQYLHLILSVIFIFIILSSFFFIRKPKDTVSNFSDVKIVKTSKVKDVKINVDSLIHAVCDTTYEISKADSTNLSQVKCEFETLMLVLSDGKITFLNDSLNKTYNLKLPLYVHAAKWSPYNRNELFVLLRDERKFKNKIIIDKYYSIESVYDLFLYSLNIKTMKMIKIAKLYDFSVPLLTQYLFEMSQFFTSDTLRIDTINKKFYLNCFGEQSGEDDLYFNSTYVINMKNKTVKLQSFINTSKFDVKKNKIEIYHEGDYSANIKDEYIEIFAIKNSDDVLKFPVDIFDGLNNVRNSDWDKNITAVQNDIIINDLQLDFYPTKDGKYIVCSPYSVEEMDSHHGNIYVINRTTNDFRILLKDNVFSQGMFNFTFLNTLSNHFYQIETYDNLYLYDSDFNKLFSFNDFQDYEMR